MSTIWVCKSDRRIESNPNSDEVSLEEMRKELAMIIGEENILHMKKKHQDIGQLSGSMPKSRNAYEISEEGWNILTTGIVGPQGFALCPETGKRDTE